MASERLEKLYSEGHMKRGCSENVDEALVVLRDLRFPPDYRVFSKLWGNFVKAVLADFPNINPFNLTYVTMHLSAGRYKKELLYIQLLLADLLPESSESHCFLGHAYRNMDRFDLALPCYKKAYQLAVALTEKRQFDPSHPIVLDTCDYLCYMAETQLKLHLYSDALMSLTKAVTIAREANGRADFKKEGLQKLISNVMDAAEWETTIEIDS